ncbi:MAG: hypothetical protein GY861_04385, partial [bacterium]|nr:hypothetical protein [bacterium]
MTITRVHAKQTLATSTDQGKLFNCWYTVDDIRFRLGELDRIDALNGDSRWLKVMSNIDGMKKPLITYQSKEGLSLYGKQFDNIYLVVS